MKNSEPTRAQLEEQWDREIDKLDELQSKALPHIKALQEQAQKCLELTEILYGPQKAR